MSPVAILLFFRINVAAYYEKKASPKTRSRCLHNGIILIVNCFVIVITQDNELNQFNKFSSNRLTLLIIKRKLWS